MDGETFLEVGVLGEVAPRVDVVIPGGDDVLIVSPHTAFHQIGDSGRDPRPARSRDTASLTEVVLHIHDDQTSAHHEPLPELWNAVKNRFGHLNYRPATAPWAERGSPSPARTNRFTAGSIRPSVDAREARTFRTHPTEEAPPRTPLLDPEQTLDAAQNRATR